jgi:DNA-binding NarL/FixJ family response regulator
MDLARSAAIISDDHELFRVALAQILSGRFGFGRVVETSSLDDALERLSDTPDVVLALFDLDMPGMTGPSSLQAVREVFPAVRVVVITASKKRDDILKALEAGVHGYIMKTLRLDEITNALKIVTSMVQSMFLWRSPTWR